MKLAILLCLAAGVAMAADEKKGDEKKTTSGVAEAKVQEREITIETKTIGGATHWVPAKIEACPGEKLKITVRHDLEGGFDFHGLLIPALKITEKVDRKKPVTLERTVPAEMKPGEYKVGCHFHEKHVPATLVVKKPSECKKSS